MKKKICFVLPSLGGGGAEKVAYNILKNINLNKFDVSLILIYKDKGDYLKELDKNTECFFLEKTNFRYSLFALIKTLKKINPEVVLIFSFEIAILIGPFIKLLFKNIKFINRQLNIISKLEYSFLKLSFLKLAYKNFDKIITQSKDMTEDLFENIDISKDKVVEINNPIDFDEIKKLSSEKKEIEFSSNSKNFLCVGRLSLQKGFDLIIKTMRLLKEENIKLYILGEGNERKNLENLIKEYSLEENVFLLGRKENPYIYMKNADLFILSSRYEGFPNVLIEANACGCYAICNDSPGGINEIIKENINGNIVNFNNEELLVKIIIEKSGEKYNREEIKNSVLERYEKKIIVEKYEKLFMEVEN